MPDYGGQAADLAIAFAIPALAVTHANAAMADNDAQQAECEQCQVRRVGHYGSASSRCRRRRKRKDRDQQQEQYTYHTNLNASAVPQAENTGFDSNSMVNTNTAIEAYVKRPDSFTREPASLRPARRHAPDRCYTSRNER